MSDLAAQMRRRDREMVPLVLVRAMFGAMLAALALVSFAVLTDRPLEGRAPPSPVVAEATVRLVAEPDGETAVLDADGAVLARSDRDLAGFIGVMARAVAQERARHGLADEAPVRVVRRLDGRVAVVDDATRRTFELAGHGRDNVAAFARLLP